MAPERINWATKIPREEIRWLVSAFSVAESDSAVETSVRTWAEAQGWARGAVSATVRFALDEHHRNQRVYLGAVTPGRIPRRLKREIRRNA